MIGSGSSSIQIVPNLQKVEGVQLTCFVRSKTWISNPFGDSGLPTYLILLERFLMNDRCYDKAGAGSSET